MSRLTIDQLENYRNTYDKFDEICDELIKYKQLENKLGCPLEVREKTLDSFYCPKFENDKKLYSYYVYGFDNCDLFVYLSYSKYDDFYDEETKIPLKDYKKTWWLKEI